MVTMIRSLGLAIVAAATIAMMVALIVLACNAESAELSEIDVTAEAVVETPPTPETKPDAKPDDNGIDRATEQAKKSGRPILVMVGASWCKACNVAKLTLWPAIKRIAKRHNVHAAIVEVQRDRVADTLIGQGGRGVPQFLFCRLTDEGTLEPIRRLVGLQEPRDVEAMIVDAPPCAPATVRR